MQDSQHGPPQQPPGWYNVGHGWMWWDGTQWNQQTLQPHTQAAQQGVPQKRGIGLFKILGLIFAGIVVLGIIGSLGSSTPTTRTERPAPTVSPRPVTSSPTPQPSPTRPAPSPRPSPTPTAEAAEAADESSIGLTVAEFVTRWNDAANTMDQPGFRFARADLQEGEVRDVFQVTLAENVGLMGTVNKSGSMYEATILGQPASTDESTTLVLAWGTLIATMEPDVTPDQRGEVLHRLRIIGDDAADDPYDHEAEFIRGPLRYWFQGSDMIGLILGVSPA